MKGKGADKPVKGAGPSTPPPFDDGGTAGGSGPRVTVAPDGTSEVVVRVGAWAQVPGLPVRVRGKAGSPTRVRVTVSSGADVQAEGGGLALLVERADGETASAPVQVALETAGLGGVFRGNWVHRLQVTTAPACVALLHAHPNRGKHKGHAYAYGLRHRCQAPATDPGDGVDVPVVDDSGDGELLFDADAGEEVTEEIGGDPVAETARTGWRRRGRSAAMPLVRPMVGTSTSALTAFVVGSGPSGSAGSFSATTLGSASKWQVGEQSGDFSTSYAVPVPAPPAGSAPAVGLGYSAQSVDGRTSANNTQASWVGMGWDLDPGSVQRSYASCAQEYPSTRYHRSVYASWGDLCWKKDNAVLSLGGSSVPLYKGSDGRWHTSADSGWRVQLRTNAPNGAHGGQYWVVTDTMGTQYWFGYGVQPTTKAPTRSAWTVPVYGGATGLPCHSSTLSKSWCMQAWKWNLDRVVDLHGNVTTYFWAPEHNKYARQHTSTLVSTYTRGGVLAHVDYGQVAGHENVAAPDRVTFTSGYRCEALTACPAPTSSNGSSFPDVPNDLICATSTCRRRYSPVFFDTKRLATITTGIRNGKTYRTVDTVTLGQSFPSPGDGTDATLWLGSITRAGVRGSTVTRLPAVRFAKVLLPNRVDYNARRGVVKLLMYRVSSVQSEFGGRTVVSYGRPQPCTTATLPSPAYNTKDCFPHYWVPPDNPAGAGFAWFHKYLVTKIVVKDPIAHGPDQVTTYQYGGTPAWHHDEDLMSAASEQSWGMWRGYGVTTVTVGTATKSVTRSRWFRGMNGDALPGGRTRSVSVTDSTGKPVVDGNWLAGRNREVQRLTPGGAELTGAITSYYARQTVNGQGLFDAWAVLPSQTDGRTLVKDPVSLKVSVRKTRARTTYDPTYLQPTVEYRDGDLATTTDDVCATTAYARNTSRWLLDSVSVQVSHPSSCGSTTILSRAEHYYDNLARLGAVPLRGDETMTRALATGSTYVKTLAAFDARGRVVSTTSGNGDTSRVAYTAAYSYGPVVRVRSARPLRRATKTVPELDATTISTLDPWRQVPTVTVDPNGHSTTVGYDALGRLVTVTRPGDGSTPGLRVSYHVSQSAPSTVVSDTRQDASTVLRSVAYADALGRTVETAVPADGGRTITATRYDDRGLVAAVTAPQLDDSPLSSSSAIGALVVPDPTSVTSETRTTYDTLGRPTVSALYHLGVLHHVGLVPVRSLNAYFGGSVVSTPPSGSATRTYVDALGRTSRIEQLLGKRVLTTRYAYDRLGRLTGVTDTAKNVSSFTYDLLGRQTGSHLPDAGSSSAKYDADGNVTSVTDARQITVLTSYDAADRPVARSVSGGARLASFSYDQPRYLGLPWKATRYDGGHPFTASVDAYDARNRPTDRTVSVPSSEGLLAGSWTTGFGYDLADHVTSVDLPAVGGLPAETVTTSYDELGRPDATGSELATYVAHTGYDAAGRVVRRDLGATHGFGSVQREYGYDEATGRLTGLTAFGRSRSMGEVMLQAQSLDYDPTGDVASVQDSLSGQYQCNHYDQLHRLVHAWTTDVACTDGAAPHSSVGPSPYDVHYRLADTGQLLTRTSAGSPAVSYTYPVPAAPAKPGGPVPAVIRPHAVTDVAGAHYAYDRAGELFRRSGAAPLALHWTAEHTLASATGPGVADSYVYDTSGVRVLRRGADSSTLTLDGAELTLERGGVTARRYYSSAGATVAVRDTSGLSWLLGDHLGTPVVAVHAGTLRSQRQLRGPYGEPRSEALSVTPRGFLNKPHDVSTGLDVLDHRSYDAVLGRLLSPDPVYLPYSPAALDPYGYAGDNPTTLSDPSGLRVAPEPDCNAECLRRTEALAVLTTILAKEEADRRNHHFWDDVDWGGDALAGAKGFVNFSAGFADSATSAITFGHNSAIAIGPAFHGPGLDASYRVGGVTSTAVQIVSGAGALKTGLMALRSLPALYREAGSVSALIGSLLSGAKSAVAARLTSVGGAIKSLLGGERVVQETGRMGGTTLGGADHATQSMIKYSNKNPAAGYHDVIGHGSPTDIAGHSASEVAQRIGSASGGQDIRLLACRTGCPTGSFAQDLANTMGVRVMAPTTDIGASTRGNTLTIFDGGEWLWFSPEG